MTTLKCSRCARPTAKPALVSGSIVLGPTCFRLAGLAHAISQAAKAPRVRVSGRKDSAQLLLWARAETPQDGEPRGEALTPDPVANPISIEPGQCGVATAFSALPPLGTAGDSLSRDKGQQ